MFKKQTADAQFFWANHPGGDAWCEMYRETSAAPARDLVVEAVRQLVPHRRVLELGCHCGPLLRRLEAIEDVVLAVGLDINGEAVQAARAAGLSAMVGTLPDALLRLSPMDVVVSSYCLAYISPEDLPRTLAECLRMARTGLVLAEPSAGPGVVPHEVQDGHYVEWWHEYLDVLVEAARLLPVPPIMQATRTRLDLGDGDVNALIVVRLQWP